MTPKDKPLIFIGMGGHAGILVDIARCLGLEILGGTDHPDAGVAASRKLGIPYLGPDDAIKSHKPTDVTLVNCLGSSSTMTVRHRCFETWKKLGFQFATLVHPRAVVAATARLGEGSQLMAGVVVQPYAVVGVNCIINTNASVDHDCDIGDSCHLAPGVNMSGTVKVGSETHIGTGAKLIQGLTIGKQCLIAAGAVVVNDVPERSMVKGVPGRIHSIAVGAK